MIRHIMGITFTIIFLAIFVAIAVTEYDLNPENICVNKEKGEVINIGKVLFSGSIEESFFQNSNTFIVTDKFVAVIKSKVSVPLDEDIYLKINDKKCFIYCDKYKWHHEVIL